MNKQTRELRIEALLHARYLIYRGEGIFVCFGILFWGDESTKKYKIAKDLVNEIDDMIYGCCSIIDWLYAQKNGPYERITYEEQREYRIRWIDHMIKQEEAHLAPPAK